MGEEYSLLYMYRVVRYQGARGIRVPSVLMTHYSMVYLGLCTDKVRITKPDIRIKYI